MDHAFGHVHMNVCLHVRSLPALSASTLNESELQYSVGGAGIEYPAGGSSTHAQPFTLTRLSVVPGDGAHSQIPEE